jgi:integrase
MKGYLLLALFTGLRKEEAARLTWENVDFLDETSIVHDTKNHQDHPCRKSPTTCSSAWVLNLLPK